MDELIGILTELLPAIQAALPNATEEEKSDLSGLARSLTELVNRASGLAKQGLSWNGAEDRELLADHRSGVSISELAKKFLRSEGAIKARLAKLLFL
jgi:hypothetical protein